MCEFSDRCDPKRTKSGYTTNAEALSDLGEVVVVGYGTQKKVNVIGYLKKP